MTQPTSELRVVAEAVAPDDGWWSAVRACAAAASQASADMMRVIPPRALLEGVAEPWVHLRRDVLRAGLDLVVTVAHADDVTFFTPVGVGGWAAPAVAARDPELGEALGASHLPVLLLAEGAGEAVDEALAHLRRFDVHVTVVHGSPLRPAPAEGSELHRLQEVNADARLARGFADRSGTGWTALAAVTLGVELVELPLTLSGYLAGSAGALEPEAFRRTVEGARYLAWARAHPGS